MHTSYIRHADFLTQKHSKPDLHRSHDIFNHPSCNNFPIGYVPNSSSPSTLAILIFFPWSCNETYLASSRPEYPRTRHFEQQESLPFFEWTWSILQWYLERILQFKVFRNEIRLWRRWQKAAQRAMGLVKLCSKRQSPIKLCCTLSQNSWTSWVIFESIIDA